MSQMGKLIVVRHHESEWNKQGRWTGLRDRHLTEYGFQKSTEMGYLLKDIKIDRAFASMKVRTIETLSCILEALGEFKVPTIHSDALNERDYGDYTSKNKWDVQDLIGKDEWEKVRRDWDCPVPNGESLKMVYERVAPFFLESILPVLKTGKNVLVVAHGNSIRAMIKYIEQVSDKDISKIEMPFGGIFVYDLNEDGFMLKKEIRQVESNVNA